MQTIFTLFAFIIGILSTLVFQYYQSKEVLKQTLYKEKLDTYRKLLHLFNRVVENLYYLNNDPSLASDNGGRLVLDLQLFLADNMFLINPEILSLCSNFTKKYLAASNSREYDELVKQDYAINLQKEITKDLGIDTLIKEVSELYGGLPALSLGLKKFRAK